MSRPRLVTLVDELHADPVRWAGRVRHDPAQRVFEQVALADDHEAWLICWMPGHDTGFHDHDLSCGAVKVVSGRVREERLGASGEVLARVYRGGEVFEFSETDIHRVVHDGSAPAVTLHVYSPRLRRMGAYAVARDGALKRRPLAYGEELRPLAI